MSNKVISFVINAAEEELNHVLAAAINELHKGGNTVHEVRVMSDTGERKIPPNTVPGVTEPAPSSTAPVETPTGSEQAEQTEQTEQTASDAIPADNPAQPEVESVPASTIANDPNATVQETGGSTNG